MSIQTENGDDNEIRSNDTRTRSNACQKCGEVGHFLRDCHKRNGQAQSGDDVDTVICQLPIL